MRRVEKNKPIVLITPTNLLLLHTLLPIAPARGTRRHAYTCCGQNQPFWGRQATRAHEGRSVRHFVNLRRIGGGRGFTGSMAEREGGRSTAMHYTQGSLLLYNLLTISLLYNLEGNRVAQISSQLHRRKRSRTCCAVSMAGPTSTGASLRSTFLLMSLPVGRS